MKKKLNSSIKQQSAYYKMASLARLSTKLFSNRECSSALTGYVAMGAGNSLSKNNKVCVLR